MQPPPRPHRTSGTHVAFPRRLSLVALVAIAACQATVVPTPSGSADGATNIPSPSTTERPSTSASPSVSPGPSPAAAPGTATWQPFAGPPDARFTDVIAVSERYVAIARTPRGSQAYSSLDGVSWMSSVDSPDLDDVWLRRIAGGGIHFVAIGCRVKHGTCVADGVWTGTNIGSTPWAVAGRTASRGPSGGTVHDVFSGSSLTSVAWASSGGFIIVGSVGGKPAAWNSADGRTWAPVAIADSAVSYSSVAGSASSGYLVVGATALGPQAWTSPTLARWTATAPFPGTTLTSTLKSGVRFKDRWWVSGTNHVPDQGDQPVVWSSPGTAWTLLGEPSPALADPGRLTVAGDHFLAFGGCDPCWPNAVANLSGVWLGFEPPLGLDSFFPTAFAGIGDEMIALGNGVAILTTRPVTTPESPRPDTTTLSFPLTAETFLPPRMDTPVAAAGGPDGSIYALWTQPGSGVLELKRYLAEQNIWSRRASTPVPLLSPVLAYGTDRRMYLLGIATDGGSAPVYAYDIKRDRWELRTHLPVPRSRPAVVALDQRLYVLGGALLGGSGAAAVGEQTPRVDIFDLRTGTWSVGTPMPATGDRFSAVALYPIPTGEPPAPTRKAIVLLLPSRAWRYDLATATWTAGSATLRQGMSGPAVIGPTNDIFVFGCDRIDSYNPTANVWHVHANLDQARCDPIVAIPFNGPMIIALGGEGGGQVQAPILRLDVGGG